MRSETLLRTLLKTDCNAARAEREEVPALRRDLMRRLNRTPFWPPPRAIPAITARNLVSSCIWRLDEGHDPSDSPARRSSAPGLGHSAAQHQVIRTGCSAATFTCCRRARGPGRLATP